VRCYAVTNWLLAPPFSYYSLYMNLLYPSPISNCCLLASMVSYPSSPASFKRYKTVTV